MAATYDRALIATDLVTYARARFRDIGGLQGTVVTKPLMEDEEYQGFIDLLGAREGLAQAAEALAAGFAQKVQRYAEAGGIDVIWPKRGEFYLNLARSIRENGLGDKDGIRALHAGRPETPDPRCDDRLRFL